jgi:hypothetical protein
VGAAVVGGDDLEILMPRAAVSILVLDARVREPDVPIVVRQLVFPRPACNLFGLPVRPTVTLFLASIALVEESLIVALQLIVEDDALNPTALAAEALLSALISAIDLRVVRQLARLSQTRVEVLAGFVRAVVAFASVGFEKVSTAIGQDNGAIVGTERARPNQSLAFEVPSALTRTVRIVAQIVQIAFGHNPECADSRQHSALCAADLVDTLSLPNGPALTPTRQI